MSLLGFCHDEDGAVTVFAHHHDVRSVDDDFLRISSFAQKNGIGLAVVTWHLVYDRLDGLTRTDNGVKYGDVGFHGFEHFDQPILIGALGRQTDEHLV